MNIIAHSMGGLDARYMISNLMRKGGKTGGGDEEGKKNDEESDQIVEVASLTTIATPHQGSAVADYIVGDVSFSSSSDSSSSSEPSTLVKFGGKEILFNFLSTLGLSTAAFDQLTRNYLQNEFNPKTPDQEGVRYFSYGASFEPRPWNAFRFPHGVMVRAGEGDNDGLVSGEFVVPSLFVEILPSLFARNFEKNLEISVISEKLLPQLGAFPTGLMN